MHQPLQVPVSRAALLLVDLQEEHRFDERFLAADFESALANARRLLLAARTAGVAVFHAQYVRDFAIVPPRPFEITGAEGKPHFSDPGSGFTAICPEVAPLPGETIVTKNDASAFAGTGLEIDLKSRNIEWLVIAGAWTEACVAASVRDATAQGFRVLLVKDACTSGSAHMHQTAILNLANRLVGGAVANTLNAAAFLSGTAASAWRLEQLVPFRFDAATVSALYEAL
jgi:maleamate amidohydrolase